MGPGFVIEMVFRLCRLFGGSLQMGRWVRRRIRAGRGAVVGLLLVAACVPVWQGVEVDSVDTAGGAVVRDFSTPARAYLSDGSIVVLPEGGRVGSGVLMAEGQRFDLTLSDTTDFHSVTTDSVIGLEVFRTDQLMEGVTVLATLASIGAGALAAAGLSVAIFGSCPTVYAEVGGETTLQMEAFSYSIAPLFESRDVAGLDILPDSSGVLRLEVRNEALETHYINHVELLEVTHGADETAVPDPNGRPMVVGQRRPPLMAHDRAGRDVLSALRTKDGDAHRSSPRRLAAANLEDLTDRVDVVVPTPGHEESVALVLDLKNTLMNSVLFYDIMLARSGPAALDWLGSDLDRIGSALEMGSWYQERMGLRVLVWEDEGWREVDHVGDVGPIAWKELAVEIPTTGSETRVRLEFVTDSWFIDRVQVASNPRRPSIRRIPVSRVLAHDGTPLEADRRALEEPDDSYFTTLPANHFQLEFDVGSPVEEVEPTYLLAAQGYYVEWIRGTWLDEANTRAAFDPDDRAVLEALHRWNEVMDEFERDFHASRISTR